MDEYGCERVAYAGGGEEEGTGNEENEEVVVEENEQEDGSFPDIQLDRHADFRSHEQQGIDFTVTVPQRQNAAEWIAGAAIINPLVDATISNEDINHRLGEDQHEDEAELRSRIREGVEWNDEDEENLGSIQLSLFGWPVNISEEGLQFLGAASIIDETHFHENPLPLARRLNGDIPWEEKLYKLAQEAITETLQPESIPEEDRKCAICFEIFEKYEPLDVARMWEGKHLPVKLRCRGQHILGSTCLYQWMKEMTPRSFNCPMCRDKLVDVPDERPLNLRRSLN